MASVNKVILVGNCGRDPEMRYLPSGKATCNISIATSSKRKDKNGEYVEETQWHRVTFFDKLAEVAGQYVKKGSPVYVEGMIKYGKYTDKDGVEKSSVDVIASALQLLGKTEAAPRQEAKPQAKQAPQGSGFDDMDSDIPWLANMTPEQQKIWHTFWEDARVHLEANPRSALAASTHLRSVALDALLAADRLAEDDGEWLDTIGH